MTEYMEEQQEEQVEETNEAEAQTADPTEETVPADRPEETAADENAPADTTDAEVEIQGKPDAPEDGVTIVFLNGGGAGFADDMLIPQGTTIDEFMGDEGFLDPNDYIIRVNNEPVRTGQVLREDDMIVINPVKEEIEGA